MSILDRIKAGTRHRTVVRWPGTDSEVTLRILSKDELHEATFCAHRRFLSEKVPVELHTIETFKDEETVQILFRALSGVGEEAAKPLAPGVDAFRASVTAEELSALAGLYEDFQREVSPCLDCISEEAFQTFLSELKKKPDAIISSVSDIAFAKRLLRSLVAQPAT